MRLAIASVAALAGCDAILGLPSTTYAVDSGATSDTTSMTGSDACVSAQCSRLASCQAIEQMFPTAPSGVYTLDAGSGEFSAYCELEADGGGWTLAMKIDGRETTFAYDAAVWTDASLVSATSAGLDNVQAKLETFNAVSFTQLRVGLEFPIGSGTRRYLAVNATAARLRDLFAGTPVTSTLGRTSWKDLVGPTASLQLACNAEGINIGNTYGRVRIGIIGNNEDDCVTPDSFIGIGAADMGQCLTAAPSAGNIACFGPDNGEVNQPAFAYVFVR